MKAVMKVLDQLNGRLKMMYDVLREMKAELVGVTPDYRGIPAKVGYVKDRIGSMLAVMQEVEAEYLELRSVMIRCRLEWGKILAGKIENGLIRAVMFYRYGYGLNCVDIGVRLRMDAVQVLRLYKAGMKVLLDNSFD